MTMEHQLTLENSSSAAVNTLPITIIYLKAVKYLNIRLGGGRVEGWGVDKNEKLSDVGGVVG